MKALDKVETRLQSFVDWLWTVERESSGRQRVRTLPILALYTTRAAIRKVNAVFGGGVEGE